MGPRAPARASRGGRRGGSPSSAGGQHTLTIGHARTEAPTSRISSPVLVGRDAELDELRSLLDEVAGGRGAAVLVGGEAGVGKTRLVRQLADDASAAAIRVLAGAAIDFGGDALPFGAVADALRPVVRELGRDTLREMLGPGVDELARLLPDVGAGDPVPDIGRDPHATARLFEVVLRLLESLAAEAPVLLVFEDLHWADPSTRAFVAFAARNTHRARLLVVATYRSDELHRTHPLRPLVASLRATGLVRSIELRPLARDVAGAQIRAILGGAVDDALVDRVYRRSLGNPLFTEELLSAGADAEGVPATIGETLLMRVDALAPETRTVLRALAVLGRPSDERLLAATAELGSATATAALRDALDHNIAVRAGDDSVTFRHALFQEAIYEDMLGSERARLHRRAAAALEGAATAPAAGLDAELARHYRRGNQPDRAIAASARAADAAARRYAFADALGQWEQVLELWEEVEAPDSIVGRDRADVLREATIAASSAGEHRRAVALAREAIGELDLERDRLRAAGAWCGLMAELSYEGDHDASEAARLRAIALVEGQPASLEHVRVLSLAVYTPLVESRYREAAASASRALAMAEEVDAVLEGGLARVPLGIALAFLGRLDEARGHLDRALEIARAVGHPQPIADAYESLGIVLEAAGRFEEAAAVFSDGLARLRELGVARTHGNTIQTNLAEAYRRLGRWGEALALLDEVLARVALGWEAAHANVVRGHVLVAMGRAREAEAGLDLARGQYGRTGTGFRGHLHAARAENAVWGARYAEAIREGRAGFDELRESADLRWLGELAVLAARGARLEVLGGPRLGSAGARIDVVALVDDYEAIGSRAVQEGTIFAGEFAANLLAARAELADTRGDGDADRWREVARSWSGLHQPYPAAYARYREAEALLRLGASRGEAAAVLSAAAGEARTLGAEPLLAAIDDLARRARLDLEVHAVEPLVADPETSRPFGLTPREREVLSLLADGRSDQEIAQALFISPKTASVHVSNVKAKLGVERRVEAALIAARVLAAGPDRTT